MNKPIYCIFSGAYSDWFVHGYMINKDDAEKYCAIKNKELRYNKYDSYYVIEINPIFADVKDVKLKYYHEVVFDFDRGMRDEPDRYEYYIGENKTPLIKYNILGCGGGWISFSFNCNDRKRAEKIAQDKYYQFLSYASQFGLEKAVELIGAKKI